MKIYTRGFIGVGLIIAIVVALVVIGSVSYYLGQQKVKEKPNEVNYQYSIKGTWIHAQEEDTENNLVYRNGKTYTPPPLRFRHYFIYKDNNVCSSLQLAPNDAQYLKDVNCSLTTDGKITFLNLDNEKYRIINQSESKLVLQKIDSMTNWKTYKNDTYGFEFTYPLSWILRDGSKDHKIAGLNNFYQLCNKVITTPSEPVGPNDNFVGSCEGEFFRINIWKPTTEMKIITNNFTTLKLEKENKIIIGDKPASEFVYSGLNQISGGTDTWHLFVVQTNKFVYSMSGDSCVNDKVECNQIISNFKFF